MSKKVESAIFRMAAEYRVQRCRLIDLFSAVKARNPDFSDDEIIYAIRVRLEVGDL